MRSRSIPAAAIVIVLSAIAGGMFGSSVSATQSGSRDDAVPACSWMRSTPSKRDYVEPVESAPAGVRVDRRDAPDARSPFELPRREVVRADARAPGGPLPRHRHQHPLDRREHHRHVAVRGLAGVPRRASAAATSSRASARKTPTTGRPSGSSSSSAGRAGTTVDISIRRPGVDKLVDLTVERDEIKITTRPDVLHDGADGRLRPAAGLLRDDGH